MKNKETLEEAAEKYVENFAMSVQSARQIGFKDGAKWQQEQDKKLYSEQDLDMFRKFMIQEQNFSKSCLDVFIEQFKKK